MSNVLCEKHYGRLYESLVYFLGALKCSNDTENQLSYLQYESMHRIKNSLKVIAICSLNKISVSFFAQGSFLRQWSQLQQRQQGEEQNGCVFESLLRYTGKHNRAVQQT